MTTSAAPNHGRINQGARDVALGTSKVAISMAAAAGSSNVSNVTIKVTNKDGDSIIGMHLLKVWLSDAKLGALTGTTASGTVTNKTSEGVVIDTLTSKKSLIVRTMDDGEFVLEITDTAKTAFHVCVALMSDGPAPMADLLLATADYG